MRAEFSLTSYSRIIANPDYNDSDRYRALTHQIPRRISPLVDDLRHLETDAERQKP